MIKNSGLYTLEMIAKIYVLGWRKYVSRHANIFDAIVTIMGLISSIASAFLGARVVRIVMLLRSFRLLRLLSNIRKFRIIFASFVALVPIFAALLGVLVAQFYFFGLLGVKMYGGLLYIDNPALVGSTYEAVGYFPNNFNDFGSAVVVLFDLMVVNNWFIYMDAIALVTNEAGRVFFFVFWFFTNLLTLNLLVATILDVVTAQLVEEEKRSKEEENRRRNVFSSLSSSSVDKVTGKEQED